MKLKSRQKQIPGGMRFYISPLKWSSQPWSSFETIVNEAVAVLQANPHVAKNLQWDISHDAMADRIDEWNAALCKSQGWTQYYVEGGTGGPSFTPFPQRQHQSLLSKLSAVGSGASTIVSWISSGAEAVAPELAEKRALVCAPCAMNQLGDLTSIFTVPVSNAIRAALNTRKDWKLSTSQDEKLFTCKACLCPIPLKIHMKLDAILPKMPKESFDALAENCWIRTEKGQA
jgi:hypothetical protein